MAGTYNNQYMIIDFKLFKTGEQLPYGLLYVIEQIPGLVVYGDQTETLKRGYWPSYNVAFYPEIYEKSGCMYMYLTHGTDRVCMFLSPFR